MILRRHAASKYRCSATCSFIVQYTVIIIVNSVNWLCLQVTLELGWSYPSDMWSVGCIIAEIYRGELFFQTVCSTLADVHVLYCISCG